MDRRMADGVPVVAEGLALTRQGQPLLADASFTLHPGRLAVLMGPNGAGKSLTLRILQGLIQPDRGRIRWPEPAPRAALVLQNPVLLARSARANLLHALAIQRVARAQRMARAAELLDLARLDHRADTAAEVLSGGERQRLAIARALAGTPGLLLLDEPTAQLDPAETARVETLIRELSASGIRIVLVTHDTGQARRLADDVIFLDRGRVTEQGPAPAFFAAPRSEAARAYLAGRLHF